MTINSRNKGKVGEREWAEQLRTLFGCDARRGVQFAGGPDSPDVVGGWPNTHAEVKRVESLNIHKAMAQAVADAAGKVPYVAHRRNRGEWLVTVRVNDLPAFVRAIGATT